MTTIPCTVAQSQDKEPGHTTDPDVKWEVRKEYDEHGNLLYYDSSCIHTWKDFDFPVQEGWHGFEDFDSLFGDFLHFPEGMFEHHPFAFDPSYELMDSLDLDFYLDSSIFHGFHGFKPFTNFPDSAWMDPFFPDSLFPGAYMPIEEFFPPDHFPLNPRSFHGPRGFSDGHKEWIERFWEKFTFPDDSLNQLHPKWQQLPRQQKKPARGIEI